MGKVVVFSVAILAVATALFFGCSSDSTSTQDTTNKSTFEQYSDNLDDVETRAALRNSWMGATETNENWGMPQNDQLDSNSVPQVPVPDIGDVLTDLGKQIGGTLIKKGLSYAIDKAFGIQTKAQKERKEENFINKSLLGIQHQLTEIQNNLTNVYSNQIKAMQTAGQTQITTISDFASLETTIINQSTDAHNFKSGYSTFIDDLQNSTNGESEGWTLNFTSLCDPTTDFLSNNYGNLDEDNRQNTILVTAYNAVFNLFGTDYVEPSKPSEPPVWPDAIKSLHDDATQYMSALTKDVTGFNIVSNYYAAGTRLSQAAYAMGDVLQKAYTVFAFTLQFAAKCPAVQAFYSGSDSGPGDVFTYTKPDNSQINLLGTVTPTNLSTYLGYLNDNFNTQFYNNAMTYFDEVVEPFLTYGGTTSQYWDTASLVSAAGLSLDSGFIQNGCFPISYVKNVDEKGTPNGNLDYLAAECNYNGDWTVLQLFIPTNNGAEGLTNISYLSDFGLIGDVDYSNIQSHLIQPGTIASAGTCSSHYDNQCTSGFDDCYVGQASMQLQPTPIPSYGSGFNNYPSPTGTPGLNQRFTFPTNYCQSGGDPHWSCTNQQWFIVFTPNGHLFQGGVQWQFCENETAHDMKNTQVNFGATGITETTQYSNGTLSFTDGSQVTDITFGGPSSNPAGQNGNTNPSWAEYGFGINVTSAPQPTASPYPLCSEGSTVSLLPIYSYTDENVETGTVTDATTITDSNGDTLTFENGYTQFTYKTSTWSRSTSSTAPDGPESMQGVWQTGTGNNIQYLHIYCTN